jgi:hypothetical protein
MQRPGLWCQAVISCGRGRAVALDHIRRKFSLHIDAFGGHQPGRVVSIAAPKAAGQRQGMRTSTLTWDTQPVLSGPPSGTLADYVGPGSGIAGEISCCRMLARSLAADVLGH